MDEHARQLSMFWCLVVIAACLVALGGPEAMISRLFVVLGALSAYAAGRMYSTAYPSRQNRVP